MVQFPTRPPDSTEANEESLIPIRAHSGTSPRLDLPLLLWRRGSGRGVRLARKPLLSTPAIALCPSPRASLAGRERPDHLTRFAPLNPRTKTDPSPHPSPLGKGRGGLLGESQANQGSGAGRSPVTVSNWALPILSFVPFVAFCGTAYFCFLLSGFRFLLSALPLTAPGADKTAWYSSSRGYR